MSLPFFKPAFLFRVAAPPEAKGAETRGADPNYANARSAKDAQDNARGTHDPFVLFQVDNRSS